MAKNDAKKTIHITEAKMFADGGSRGNPGPSASGYGILDMHDNIILKEGIYLGITTNNQAEYRALKFGLEKALELEIKNINVYMDSLLVINQMKGIYKVKNKDLWPVHNAIKDLAQGFESISYNHVPRELNKLADSMVNEALDAQIT
jgi:ribonuclease HI